jgi:hypothetical protein
MQIAPTRRILGILAIAWALAALLAALAPARADAPLDPASPLDTASREVNPKGPVRCPDLPFVSRRAPYHKAIRVHPDFDARLRAFEAVLAEVATRFYGRPPTTIRHIGTYKCRRISRFPHLVSEHGLGNAIDIAAFRFGPLPRGARLPANAPAAASRAFEVTVLDHWDAPASTRTARAKLLAHHSAFLRALAAALDDRPDIFRVMLGPGYPGHKDHFHFDAAPYRLVAW